MLSVPHDNASHKDRGVEWHRGDDLIHRARFARARWVRQVAGLGLGWLAQAFGRLLGGWFTGRRRRAEINQLLALDDRTLRDIGLRREDLLALAHGETTLERLNADRYGGPRGVLVELRARERRRAQAPTELDRAA